jgi:hypothetical protein
VQRHRGRPHAALGTGDRDELAAVGGVRGLLARDPVAHRARPLRGGADAGGEGVGRERERDDVAQAGLHRRAQQAGLLGRGQQDQPDLGVRRGEIARQVEHRGAAERVVKQHDVDVDPAQRALQLVDRGRDVDDLQVRRTRLRGRGLRDLVVGDGDQDPRAQRMPSCERRRGRARWPHSGHGEWAISSPHHRQPHASRLCSTSRARPSGSAGQITASTSLPVPQ